MPILLESCLKSKLLPLRASDFPGLGFPGLISENPPCGRDRLTGCAPGSGGSPAPAALTREPGLRVAAEPGSAVVPTVSAITHESIWQRIPR